MSKPKPKKPAPHSALSPELLAELERRFARLGVAASAEADRRAIAIRAENARRQHAARKTWAPRS